MSAFDPLRTLLVNVVGVILTIGANGIVVINRLLRAFHYAKVLSSLRRGEIANARRHFEKLRALGHLTARHMMVDARILINERKSAEASKILAEALKSLRGAAPDNDCDGDYLENFALYYLSLIERDPTGDRFRVRSQGLKPRRIVASSLPFPPHEISID